MRRNDLNGDRPSCKTRESNVFHILSYIFFAFTFILYVGIAFGIIEGTHRDETPLLNIFNNTYELGFYIMKLFIYNFPRQFCVWA